MRNAAVATIVVVLFMAGDVLGAERLSARDRELAQYAKDISSKIVSRSSGEVVTSARDCNLHIEFSALKAAFDLPLRGTTVAGTDTEDSVIVNNKLMTRTLKDRSPEAFQNLILRVNRHDYVLMMRSLEGAIALCSDASPSVASR